MTQRRKEIIIYCTFIFQLVKQKAWVKNWFTTCMTQTYGKNKSHELRKRKKSRKLFSRTSKNNPGTNKQNLFIEADELLMLLWKGKSDVFRGFPLIFTLRPRGAGCCDNGGFRKSEVFIVTWQRRFEEKITMVLFLQRGWKIRWLAGQTGTFVVTDIEWNNK